MMPKIIAWAIQALIASTLILPRPGLAGPRTGTTLPRQITVTAENAFPPWSLPDGRGAANAIVRAAFKSQGIDVDLQTVPYARCRRAVISGDATACLSMGASEDTLQAVLLPAVPLVQANAVLMVADGQPPLTGCNPAGWRQTPQIGIVNGYDYPPEWEAIARSGRAKIVTVQSDSAGLRMLGAGRLDAMALVLDPLRTANVLMRQAGQTFAIRPLCPLGEISLYVGFNARLPGSPALIQTFEDGYRTISANGTLEEIMTEWRLWIDHTLQQGESQQAERRNDP